MTLAEIHNHKDYNPKSHINMLWSEFDQCMYLIVETYNNLEIIKLK